MENVYEVHIKVSKPPLGDKRFKPQVFKVLIIAKNQTASAQAGKIMARKTFHKNGEINLQIVKNTRKQVVGIFTAKSVLNTETNS